jgi:hypothetical protein
MPDGDFQFLLNCIDHGIKKLASIPLVAKWAASVALRLLTIFTKQGPPTILQTDNGSKFPKSVSNHVGRQMLLDDGFMELVMKEVKNLWPECKPVLGSPYHSEPNGGVERVNQMMQKKLGAWMKENNSTHWAIGCKICQWWYNNQVYQTINDTPYHLTYGQHPQIGISNLPLAPSVLNNLSTVADLHVVYLGLKEGMMDDGTAKESLAAKITKTTFAKQIAEVSRRVSASVRSSSNQTPKHSNAKIVGQPWCEINRAKRIALQKALLGEPTLMLLSAKSPMSPSAMSPSPVEMPAGQKTVGDVESSTCCMELINNHEDPVTMENLIHAKLKTLSPIIQCINNKDITNPENWQPCILMKVSKDSYEVLNIHETDKVGDDLDWGGDDGLNNNWTLYYKYPEQNLLASIAADAEHTQLCEEVQDTTPRRYSICSRASENLKNKADPVKTKALKSSPKLPFKLKDVVLVSLDNVDGTKVDGASLVGVIVSINNLSRPKKVLAK